MKNMNIKEIKYKKNLRLVIISNEAAYLFSSSLYLFARDTEGRINLIAVAIIILQSMDREL